MREYQKLLVTAAIIFGVAYLLNFAWESLHYPLYECKWPLSSCAIVTSFWDAVIITGMYLGGIFLFQEKFWIFRMTKTRAALLALAAFLIAYFIELQGLSLHKWVYTASMPVIPYLGTGLSPMLQMLLLPFLTFYLAKQLDIKHFKPSAEAA